MLASVILHYILLLPFLLYDFLTRAYLFVLNIQPLFASAIHTESRCHGYYSVAVFALSKVTDALLRKSASKKLFQRKQLKYRAE